MSRVQSVISDITSYINLFDNFFIVGVAIVDDTSGGITSKLKLWKVVNSKMSCWVSKVEVNNGDKFSLFRRFDKTKCSYLPTCTFLDWNLGECLPHTKKN